MKLGVVCEGETDYLAIKYYVGEELKRKNIDSSFVMLQPPPDRSSGGGWTNVITWLENNPPESRDFYFGSGLFAGDNDKANIDAILIQLDTDVLLEQSFFNFLNIRGYKFGSANSILEKSDEISKMLLHFSKIQEVRPEFRRKYLAVPIADSSEAWCVAMDEEFRGSPELLQGQALVDAFGAALARFRRKEVQASYKNVNKNIRSREAYCDGTKHRVDRLISCSLFGNVVQKIIEI
ncbi:hypothetical protein [Comamonas testosteroni]|uniref:hypothetical protein n=1 Tax=Comamonas testosteroni TaxID=285 RepID=UPI000B18E469|nr:hypothetical protein [Comamonas testosteroni]